MSLKNGWALAKIVCQSCAIGFHAAYNSYRFSNAESYGKLVVSRLKNCSEKEVSGVRKELVRKLEFVNRINNFGFLVLFGITFWSLFF